MPKGEWDMLKKKRQKANFEQVCMKFMEQVSIRVPQWTCPVYSDRSTWCPV